MGEIRINLTNFITIGLIAFVFTALAAWGMKAANIKMPGGL